MWWWVLFWAVLVLGSAAYLAWRLWRLWQRARALGREIATAQERLERVEGQLDRLNARLAGPDELAVWANPVELAVETSRVRQRTREERHRRRAASAPAWARHLDHVD